MPADRVGLRLDAQIEHAAPCVAERPGIRIVDALTQDALIVGHERRDDVDELREAPDPHAIGIPQQRVDEAADEQRVLEVVDLFEQPRRGGAAAVARLRAARAIPDVPFVERQPQPLGRALQALHVVADRRHFVDVAIHVEVHRQVARAAVARPPRRVAVVRVKREAVDLVVALLEHFAVPDEVGRHERAARSAGDQLQLRIDDPHLLAPRRAPCGRTRGPAAARSATGRPFRCRDTSSARCAAVRSRATRRRSLQRVPRARLQYST